MEADALGMVADLDVVNWAGTATHIAPGLHPGAPRRSVAPPPPLAGGANAKRRPPWVGRSSTTSP